MLVPVCWFVAFVLPNSGLGFEPPNRGLVPVFGGGSKKLFVVDVPCCGCCVCDWFWAWFWFVAPKDPKAFVLGCAVVFELPNAPNALVVGLPNALVPNALMFQHDVGSQHKGRTNVTKL